MFRAPASRVNLQSERQELGAFSLCCSHWRRVIDDADKSWVVLPALPSTFVGGFSPAPEVPNCPSESGLLPEMRASCMALQGLPSKASET